MVMLLRSSVQIQVVSCTNFYQRRASCVFLPFLLLWYMLHSSVMLHLLNRLFIMYVSVVRWLLLSIAVLLIQRFVIIIITIPFLLLVVVNKLVTFLIDLLFWVKYVYPFNTWQPHCVCVCVRVLLTVIVIDVVSLHDESVCMRAARDVTMHF